MILVKYAISSIGASISVGIALSLMSLSANAGLFGYSNYYECVLDKMPGVKNDIAAHAIIRSCREKAPETDVGSTFLSFGRMSRTECIAKYAKEVASEVGVIQVRIACNRLYES